MLFGNVAKNIENRDPSPSNHYLKTYALARSPQKLISLTATIKCLT